jgi:formamidopyrimidine-DNA glycosylase
MTGQLLFSKPQDPIELHTHVVFSFDNADIELRYRDIRRFGRIKILTEMKRFTAPDAWAAPVEEIYGRLRKKYGMLKHVLLNQAVVAGLGNIYVDETLFRSKLHPRKTFEKITNEKLRELCAHMRDVLKQSIDLGGTSFRNYVDTQGGRGGFRGDLLVYGKQGTPCPSCKTTIKKSVVAGRGTHYCPRCQRA